MLTNEIYFPNGRREQFNDDEIEYLKKEVAKFTSDNSANAPLICECGDHITGDYAFVDGKYLCPVCMEW